MSDYFDVVSDPEFVLQTINEYAPGTRLIVYGDHLGNLEIRDYESGEILTKINDDFLHEDDDDYTVAKVIFSPDYKKIYCFSAANADIDTIEFLTILDINTFEILEKYNFSTRYTLGDLLNFSFIDNDRCIMIIKRSNNLIYYLLENDTLIKFYEEPNNFDRNPKIVNNYI